MRTDSESLDVVADGLESLVGQLRGLLAARRCAAPGAARSDLAALKRIRVARNRLQAMLGPIGEAPEFVTLELLALVGARLAEDAGVQDPGASALN